MLPCTWAVGQKNSPLYRLRAFTPPTVQALRLRKFKKYEGNKKRYERNMKK